MEIQAMLQIGNNESQIYTKQYNVVNLHCHFSRHTGNSRPDTDARCERIDITLVAPGMNDVSLYHWYISGDPLSGRVSLDLTNGLGNASQGDGALVFEDAYCFAMEEDYHIDKQMRRTVRLSIVADKVTFEGATFKNPYVEQW